MSDEPDLGFLDITCARCGASASDGPMYPGCVPGEWLCEGCEPVDAAVGALFALCHMAGVTRTEGDCRDCFGMGKLPDVAACAAAGDHAVWMQCPTCLGHQYGGNA